MADIRFFDTHAHYFDDKYTACPGGVDGLLTDPTFVACVRGVINVGTNPENSRVAVAQARRYPFMFAAVGIHPTDCQGMSIPNGVPMDPVAEIDALRDWLSDPETRRQEKIVAIGEIGLDYHWQPVDRERQMAFFEGQMSLAEELHMPVIIHDREAHGDSLDVALRHPAVRGVFHCYSGSAEIAHELVKRGWYLAFGGATTYKSADRLRSVVASVPPDHLLLETDCPYMTPVPHGRRPNHSGLLPAIADVVAGLHGISPAALAEITFRNARKLFDLDGFFENL